MWLICSLFEGRSWPWWSFMCILNHALATFAKGVELASKTIGLFQLSAHKCSKNSKEFQRSTCCHMQYKLYKVSSTWFWSRCKTLITHFVAFKTEAIWLYPFEVESMTFELVFKNIMLQIGCKSILHNFLILGRFVIKIARIVLQTQRKKARVLENTVC